MIFWELMVEDFTVLSGAVRAEVEDEKAHEGEERYDVDKLLRLRRRRRGGGQSAELGDFVVFIFVVGEE